MLPIIPRTEQRQRRLVRPNKGLKMAAGVRGNDGWDTMQAD